MIEPNDQERAALPSCTKQYLTDLENLRDLVAQMRQAQRQYFKTREPEALRRSKAYEKTVDSILESRDQPELF